MLGNDENEGLENPEEFATGEETTYDDGAGEDFAETGDLDGEQVSEEGDENSDASDSKAKAKLVKTTYHYVTDKSEDKSGNRYELRV